MPHALWYWPDLPERGGAVRARENGAEAHLAGDRGVAFDTDHDPEPDAA